MHTTYIVATIYVVSVNRPGFLPEAEPVVCTSIIEARAVISSELLETYQRSHEDEVPEAAYRAAVDLASIIIPGQAIGLGDYAHGLDAIGGEG